MIVAAPVVLRGEFIDFSDVHDGFEAEPSLVRIAREGHAPPAGEDLDVGADRRAVVPIRRVEAADRADGTPVVGAEAVRREVDHPDMRRGVCGEAVDELGGQGSGVRRGDGQPAREDRAVADPMGSAVRRVEDEGFAPDAGEDADLIAGCGIGASGIARAGEGGEGLFCRTGIRVGAGGRDIVGHEKAPFGEGFRNF